MIERKPLRDQVAAEILTRIADGRLTAGVRLNESHLAAELGLSRTPLREALLVLLADGIIASEMGRGFAVPALRRRELAEVGGVLALIEPEAVRRIGAVPAKTVMELQNTLARGRLAGAPGELAILAYRLVEILATPCPDETLRDLVLRMNGRTLRYVHAGLAAGWRPETWLGGWGAVVEALRTRDHEGAAARLGRVRAEMTEELASRVEDS